MVTTGSRFDKFSERAQQVLSLAQTEAQRHNHNYMGTEHILLGLLRETEGVAARVLFSFVDDLNKVRSIVELIIVRGKKPAQGEIRMTSRAQKVVELAVDEARRMNHTHIDTEHLLIGLLREGEGVAAGVLETLGVILDKVRAETHRILGELEPLTSKEGAEVEAEPDLVSLAQQLVALQEEAENIETRIAAIEELQQTLPALEDERQEKQQEIREAMGKLRALLQETESQ